MNIESFINTSNFILENIDVQKANGAVKLFQGKTCVICLVFGPYQSNYAKNYKRGTLEINIKSNKEKEIKTQKSLEFSLANSLDSVICFEEYPGTILKINLAIVSEDGSLFSTLFNSAMLGLLKNGVSLRNTLFCYSIGVNEKVNFERLLYFPNKEEENQADSKFEVIFDLFTHEIQYFTSMRPIKQLILDQIQKDCSKENQMFIEIIKNYLTSFSS